jgi:hypothetical protein
MTALRMATVKNLNLRADCHRPSLASANPRYTCHRRLAICSTLESGLLRGYSWYLTLTFFHCWNWYAADCLGLNCAPKGLSWHTILWYYPLKWATYVKRKFVKVNVSIFQVNSGNIWWRGSLYRTHGLLVFLQLDHWYIYTGWRTVYISWC